MLQPVIHPISPNHAPRRVTEQRATDELRRSHTRGPHTSVTDQRAAHELVDQSSPHHAPRRVTDQWAMLDPVDPSSPHLAPTRTLVQVAWAGGGGVKEVVSVTGPCTSLSIGVALTTSPPLWSLSSTLSTTTSAFATTCAGGAASCPTCFCGICPVIRGVFGTTASGASSGWSTITITILRRGSPFPNPVALHLFPAFSMAADLVPDGSSGASGKLLLVAGTASLTTGCATAGAGYAAALPTSVAIGMNSVGVLQPAACGIMLTPAAVANTSQVLYPSRAHMGNPQRA